jgi:26S proteasome regulatory subunit N1
MTKAQEFSIKVPSDDPKKKEKPGDEPDKQEGSSKLLDSTNAKEGEGEDLVSCLLIPTPLASILTGTYTV